MGCRPENALGSSGRELTATSVRPDVESALKPSAAFDKVFLVVKWDPELETDPDDG